MANIKRDGYSGFDFFQALKPQLYTTWANAGRAIDTVGYDTCTFVINAGTAASAGALGATSFIQLKLVHALADTYETAASASAGTWSEVYPSQMLHSVIGMAGAYSSLDSGIFQSITSGTTGEEETVFAVGYKGPRRFVRIYVSGEDGASDIEMGAIAILGLPGTWPVNSPVGD